MTVRRIGVVVMLVLASAGAQAQPPAGGGAGGPPAERAAGRFGLENDPDPVGAIIERRAALALSDAQFAALRDLRRWHQRAVRQVRDSLDGLGLASPEGRAPTGGPPGRGGPPRMVRPDSSGPAGRPEVRALLDSTRHWTHVARDSAMAILTPSQRDSLAAVWTRFRDSLPARLRERGRPPGP